MADLADGAQPGAWYLRAGRAAGAGLTGAAVGAGVAGIWRAGWEAAGTLCGGPGTTFCIPAGPVVAAVLGSGALICAGVFAGFLLFRVRPKRLTIPVGCILAALLLFAVGAGLPGGAPPPAWTAGLAAGAGLASLALAVDSGRAQVAGLVAVVVVVVGAFALPHVVRSPVGPDTRDQQQLAALGFPLLLPVAAGYHASAASAVDGRLSVFMSADAPGGSALSRRPAFTVGIIPASGGAAKPDVKPDACGSTAPPARCLELTPGLWLLTDGDTGYGGEVITWRGDLEVEAMSLGYSPVSDGALVQAATDLRPATAAALAGLRG